MQRLHELDQFRDHVIAAPLKPPCTKAGSGAPETIPRSRDRGPIEALPLLLLSPLQFEFRDHVIAAPLKPRAGRTPERTGPQFRDHVIAAPLKLERKPVRSNVWDQFRDHVIAAPLKLVEARRGADAGGNSAIT